MCKLSLQPRYDTPEEEMSQTRMKEAPAAQLEAPRFENGGPLLIAGILCHYTSGNMNNIPAKWQRFSRRIGKITAQVGRVAYGLCLNPSSGTDGIDYLSGVEVSNASDLPGEFSCVNIPEQKYAIFPHRQHVSKLRETLEGIGHNWLPEYGQALAPRNAGALTFFERYSEEFDPRTGMGGMEVWIPIKS